MASLSHTPAPVQRSQVPEAVAPTQRKPRANEGGGPAGAATEDGFSRLLQAAGLTDMVGPAAVELPDTAPAADTSLEKLPLQVAAEGEAPANDVAWSMQSLMEQAAQRDWSEQSLVEQAAQRDWGAQSLVEQAAQRDWSAQSLVEQTVRLDQSADVMVRNGTHLQAQLDAGEPSSLLRGAAHALRDTAAQVPVAAQGVAVAAGATVGVAPQAAAVVDGAMTWSAARDAAQSLTDAVAGTAAADEGSALGRMDHSTEDRVALQGQWVTADRQPAAAEAMQRLLGQMSQFLSATGATDVAGLRRGNGKAVDESVAGTADVAGVSAGIGMGAGRLLDSAVAQAAASQQAGQAGAEQASAEPDMAFWMNARQQKAEVVLDRDGEPVRVQVTMEGNTAHVMFRSDEQATRAMLDASVAQLRDLLAAQGVELVGVQVGGDTQGQAQRDGSGARDAFMPEGARRLRLPSAGSSEGVSGMARSQTAARSGVDVFA